MKTVAKGAVLLSLFCLLLLGVIVIGGNSSHPVHTENVSCDTGTGVSCHATLVNENNKTGYYLAVKVIGYDADGNVVTTYTNDATDGGDGIMDVPPGGTDNISISTSSPSRVVDGDIRVIDVEAVE